MNIADPIYGRFTLSDPIRSLCLTPEVRRLSQIRLLNTLTPSLATLGEIRRFSHTLGVLHLASANTYLNEGGHRDAFAAAVLLHDIGTPPFGHLLEYHFKERWAWSHESIITQILDGTNVRENRAHQIFANQTTEFRVLLEKSNIDISLVKNIVSGKHPLSKLLFGTLDFDNLDNVARMNLALGQLHNTEDLLTLARNLSVSEAGELILSEAHRPHVLEWLRLRNAAYEIIVFDPPTVAAQAVLSGALEIALEAGILQKDDWNLTDEGLIDLLLKCKQTKQSVSRQYLGHLPEQLFVMQISGNLHSLGLESRAELVEILRDELKSCLGVPSLAYTFIDNGTFTKEVSIRCPESGEFWSAGRRSQSVILYAFVKASQSVSHRKSLRAVQAIIERLQVDSSSILRCLVGAKPEELDAQQKLNIAP